MLERPTWIIEYGIFHENEDALKEHTDKIHWIMPGKVDISSLPSGIFYGSIQIGRQIHRRRNDILTWLGDKWYDPNMYGPLLDGEYVNWSHCAVPKYVLDQKPMWDFYSAIFGGDVMDITKNPIFIKSYSGYKQFTGHLVHTREEYERASSLCDPNHLIMLAPDKSESLGREWRCVVDWRDGEYFHLTHSLYEDPEDKYLSSKIGPPHYLNHTVLPNLANSYLPPMFTVDVCEYSIFGTNTYKVMEINSLLSAGWYDCDVESIVKAVEYWYANTKS